MNGRDVPDFRNPPLNDAPHDNHVSFYLTVFHLHCVLGVYNNQFIPDGGDGDRSDRKGAASQLCQSLEERLQAGNSDMVALDIRQEGIEEMPNDIFREDVCGSGQVRRVKSL